MVEGNSLAPGSRHKISYMWLVQGGLGMVGADQSWNNGKEVPRLDLTSLTMPGQQIRVIGCRVAVPHSHWLAVPTLLFIYISQLLRDSFSVSQQPPIWEPPSHYSMHQTHQTRRRHRQPGTGQQHSVSRILEPAPCGHMMDDRERYDDLSVVFI